MADITMPQLGETVTEGTITKWYKQVGDGVAEDETLFEVSTDKVDSEVPSPVSGFVTQILVPEGATVDVGVVLAVVEDSPAGSGAGNGSTPAEAPVTPVDQPPVSDPPPVVEPAPVAAAVPPAAAVPAAAGTVAEPVPAAAGAMPGSAPIPTTSTGSSRLLSPVVRRLVAEHGLDPATIPGTGEGGRITRNDVLSLVEDRGRAGTGAAPMAPAQVTPAPVAPAPAVGAMAPPVAPTGTTQPFPPATAGERDEVIPFSNIRRRTAEHMVRSRATSAHALVVVEVDYDRLERVRLAERAAFKTSEGVSLTYLSFIARATTDAIREFPQVNASVGPNELIVHHDIHLGIAVDLDFNGLMVPVVHDADGKRLRSLAREIADLAARARTKKLGPDDIAGGTFTITNPGPFGTLMTAAVINQPQVAILSTDSVKKRPVVVTLPDGSDTIAIHPVGNLALSWDHRAFDGAYAASFVARIKEIIETRDWAAELS